MGNAAWEYLRAGTFLIRHWYTLNLAVTSKSPYKPVFQLLSNSHSPAPWHVPVTLALGRLKQEKYEFDAIQ